MVNNYSVRFLLVSVCGIKVFFLLLLLFVIFSPFSGKTVGGIAAVGVCMRAGSSTTSDLKRK